MAVCVWPVSHDIGTRQEDIAAYNAHIGLSKKKCCPHPHLHSHPHPCPCPSPCPHPQPHPHPHGHVPQDILRDGDAGFVGEDEEFNPGFSATVYRDDDGVLRAGWGHVLTTEEAKVHREGSVVDDQTIAMWFEQDQGTSLSDDVFVGRYRYPILLQSMPMPTSMPLAEALSFAGSPLPIWQGFPLIRKRIFPNIPEYFRI